MQRLKDGIATGGEEGKRQKAKKQARRFYPEILTRVPLSADRVSLLPFRLASAILTPCCSMDWLHVVASHNCDMPRFRRRDLLMP